MEISVDGDEFHPHLMHIYHTTSSSMEPMGSPLYLLASMAKPTDRRSGLHLDWVRDGHPWCLKNAMAQANPGRSLYMSKLFTAQYLGLDLTICLRSAPDLAIE